MKHVFFKKYFSFPSRKRYIFYSIGYGLSSLIVPFTVQFLVNSLALAGIWANILSLLVVITTGLVLNQLMKFCQFILLEYFQREIFVSESERWQHNHKHKAHYFFEVPSLLKSFSKSFSDVVEMFLVTIFGLMVLIAFHPAFLVFVVIIVSNIWFVLQSYDLARDTSIEESGAKYDMYYQIRDGQGVGMHSIENYLTKRNSHFRYLRRSSYLVSAMIVAAQVLLLGLGIFLVQKDQLSIGQFVSAEIILSGILVAIGKLPKALEAILDFETSVHKLEYALGEDHD